MLKTILTYVLCLLSVAARAQMRTDSIAEVTVQGQRVQGDVLSATPYRTIGREQFQTLGLTALADAVKMLAGADVKDYGGIGGLKTVSVRNIGAHHTAVSYDGICISNTQAGQIDIGRYTLDNIEEVALAVGQTGDLLQSARHYAAAALLNITTERPRRLSSRPSFQLSLRTGSFGLLNPSLRLWQPLGSRTLVAAHADYLRADGNYPFTLVNGRQQTRQHRNNTDIGAWKGEINLYHTFRDSSQLDLKAYYYYSQRGLPGVVILYNNSNHERLWDENFFTQARWRKSFNSHWKLQARLKYEHAWNRYEDTNTKYAGGKLTDINRQDEYYASATLAYTPTANLDFALAQDLAVNCLRTNVEPQPDPRRFTSLSALTARYHDSRLTIGANLVATFINEHVANGSAPDDRKRLSPSLSLSYRLLRHESLFLRAMIKGTFRVPTFTDMYYLHIGNTGLRPERATEYNVGLTWSSRLWKRLALQLTLDGYINRVNDKIVCFPTTYVWRMTNFGRVHIAGADATLALQMPIYKKVSMQLSAAYSLQRAIDKTDPRRESYNRQLPYTPRHSGNAALTLLTPWLNIGYRVNACGERWSMAQQSEEYRMKAYWDHNLSVSRRFDFHSFRLHLSGTLQNLTNTQYEIIQYYPMPGRNFNISATAEF